MNIKECCSTKTYRRIPQKYKQGPQCIVGRYGSLYIAEGAVYCGIVEYTAGGAPLTSLKLDYAIRDLERLDGIRNLERGRFGFVAELNPTQAVMAKALTLIGAVTIKPSSYRRPHRGKPLDSNIPVYLPGTGIAAHHP